MATVLLLQTRGRVTAAELASELETSVATARRDLAALSAAGVPVYPQPGRGGGWELVGGARTDLTGLTAPEAEALFVLLGSARSTTDAGHRGESATVLRKLVRALPATFRADAEIAAATVHVDPTRWGAAPAPVQDRLRELQNAVVRRLVLLLDYRRGSGERNRVEVEPLGLIDKGGRWYLVGDTEAGRRTFRVDRIATSEPTGDRFERPADLDLAAYWEETVTAVERLRASVWATIRLDRRYVPIVRDHFAAAFEEIDRGDPVTVRVGAHLAVSLAEQLAGWGSLVEVLGPPEVRAELGRIGAELVARYAP